MFIRLTDGPLLYPGERAEVCGVMCDGLGQQGPVHGQADEGEELLEDSRGARAEVVDEDCVGATVVGE